MRSPKEILRETRAFAVESPRTSWWCFASTTMLLVLLVGIATSDLIWPARLSASLLAGLTLVRLFIIFHDHQHGAIFRGSRVANWLMWAFGILSLNPPSVWKSSHDHHHRYNSRDLIPNVGSFPVMTIEEYSQASSIARTAYHISRHPVMMGLGYFTVFIGRMCLTPLFSQPLRHLDAALSLLCHFGLAWLLFPGFDDLLFGWAIPFLTGSALGTYLFFAQHNFPGVQFRTGKQWSYVFSALHASSYLKTGPVLSWFTGNIGYHHVHHLNPRIPFYRLPEAMAAIGELQTPPTTSLAIRDILSCLRLKLWNPAANRMEPWPELPRATTSPSIAVRLFKVLWLLA